MTSPELVAWQEAIGIGDPARLARTARELTIQKSKIDNTFHFTVCDKYWRPIGSVGGDLMEASGTDPRNDIGTAKITVKGDSPLIQAFMDCRSTAVFVLVETNGLRWPYYIQTHRYKYENSAWTGNAELRSIRDVLSYMVIWPTWWLPLAVQPFSHACFIAPLCTAVESMVAECAIRLQSGWMEFINNAVSLNNDVKAWFGTVLQAVQRDGLSIATFTRMLKTPIYVQRTNPLLDGSPLIARTVRMEPVQTVISEVCKPYGVDTRLDLWLPGDPQPDRWAGLDQPTYVFSSRDRSQISGPTKTVLDSVLRNVVDLTGSVAGGIFGSVVQQVPGMKGTFYAPKLGINFEQPYAILIAPEPGEDSSILSCEIADHTPEGWQHIIGGRSPKWVCPPLGNWGGTGPKAKLTQRFNECLLRLGDRFPDDRLGIRRGALRFAGRVPE